MRYLLGLSACLLFAGIYTVNGAAAKEEAGRVPVLAELFTSEGCSSCPPADRVLEKLDREQSVAGAQIIVLSEHVDYWNSLGWSDPFSSALYSERQTEYARHLDGQTYTPELVVDGVRGLVGSDERAVQQVIREASKRPKAALQVTAERLDKRAKVSIHIDGSGSGILYVALAHDAIKSQVLRGENAGRGLSHVAVVYSIEKVAGLDGKRPDFERTVNVKPGDSTRIVAFVAEAGSGRVIAVGQTKL